MSKDIISLTWKLSKEPVPSADDNAGNDLFKALVANQNLIPDEWKKPWVHILFAGGKKVLNPKTGTLFIPTLFRVHEMFSSMESKYYKEWLSSHTKIDDDGIAITKYYNTDLAPYF